MKVKALVSFAGLISMAFKEVRDIEDKKICEDLLRAGYVELVESEEQNAEIEKIDNEPVEKTEIQNNSSEVNNEEVSPKVEEKPSKKKKKVKPDEDQ